MAPRPRKLCAELPFAESLENSKINGSKQDLRPEDSAPTTPTTTNTATKQKFMFGVGWIAAQTPRPRLAITLESTEQTIERYIRHFGRVKVAIKVWKAKANSTPAGEHKAELKEIHIGFLELGQRFLKWHLLEMDAADIEGTQDVYLQMKELCGTFGMKILFSAPE